MGRERGERDVDVERGMRIRYWDYAISSWWVAVTCLYLLTYFPGSPGIALLRIS